MVSGWLILGEVAQVWRVRAYVVHSVGEQGWYAYRRQQKYERCRCGGTTQARKGGTDMEGRERHGGPPQVWRDRVDLGGGVA